MSNELSHSQILDNIRMTIKSNLRACCCELLDLDETGVLPANGIVRGLVQEVSTIQDYHQLMMISSLVNEAAREFIIKNT